MVRRSTGLAQIGSAAVLEPAIHDVFVVTLVLTAVLLVVGLLMPARVAEPETPVPAETGAGTVS